MKKFIKKRDILIIVAVAAVCAAALLLHSFAQRGMYAVVEYDGACIAVLDLSADGAYRFDCYLPVTLEVRGGAVRFVDSICPDHVCMQFGWLDKAGDTAVCMPARALVRVVSKADA